jgi:hypothetical protein
MCVCMGVYVFTSRSIFKLRSSKCEFFFFFNKRDIWGFTPPRSPGPRPHASGKAWGVAPRNCLYSRGLEPYIYASWDIKAKWLTTLGNPWGLQLWKVWKTNTTKNRLRSRAKLHNWKVWLLSRPQGEQWTFREKWVSKETPSFCINIFLLFP